MKRKGKKYLKKRKNFKRFKRSIKINQSQKGYKIFKFFIIFILIILYIGEIKKIPNVNLLANIINNNENSFNGRIFLCTTYNNEAETVYIHLWRLYDYVDKFVIVISNKTYQGRPKNFTFKPFEKEIERYKDKIDIANFDMFATENYIAVLV